MDIKTTRSPYTKQTGLNSPTPVKIEACRVHILYEEITVYPDDHLIFEQGNIHW